MDKIVKEVKKVVSLIRKRYYDEDFWDNIVDIIQETIDQTEVDFWVSEGWCRYPDQMDGRVIRIKFFSADREVASEEDAVYIDGILLCTNCLSYKYSKGEPLHRRLTRC